MRYPKKIVCPHFHFIPGFRDFILGFGFQCVFMGSKQKWRNLWGHSGVLQLLGNNAVGSDPNSAMNPKSLVMCQQFF